MPPNTPKIKEERRSKKTLGVRLSGSTSLTRRVNSPRRSGTSSSVRHLQPPLNTDSFRHPDYAQGRDSLTVIMDPSGSCRVEDPHFADQNSQVRPDPEPSSTSLWQIIHDYKDQSIKQACAAHHEKQLISHMNEYKPPLGILRPIMQTVYKDIMPPSNCESEFVSTLRHATEKFCLEITNILAKEW